MWGNYDRVIRFNATDAQHLYLSLGINLYLELFFFLLCDLLFWLSAIFLGLLIAMMKPCICFDWSQM